jgi:hypothetical protein
MVTLASGGALHPSHADQMVDGGPVCIHGEIQIGAKLKDAWNQRNDPWDNVTAYKKAEHVLKKNKKPQRKPPPLPPPPPGAAAPEPTHYFMCNGEKVFNSHGLGLPTKVRNTLF